MEFIDLNKQYAALKQEIDDAIQNVLNKGNYILGEDVDALEEELSRFVGVKHCITCANGTDALSIAIKTLGIDANDAVFIPTFTFFASAETVSLNGSHCVFVDVDPNTFNMSPQSLERAILAVLRQGLYRPKAIVAVDLFGQSVDYPAIQEIADQYGLYIIEDGAQGFGGSIGNKRNCSFGAVSTTSFFPAKPLGCYGDGGAIFTNNDDYAKLIRSLRFHGRGGDKYDNVRIGYNSRLDTIQAAILRVKLKAFESYELQMRNKIAAKYDQLLSGVVKTPYIVPGNRSSYAQYTLLLDSEGQRDFLQQFLKKNSIPSMVYYPKCMHEQTVYRNYNFNLDDLTIANSLTKRVLAIPMHPYLTDDEIEGITGEVRAGILEYE